MKKLYVILVLLCMSSIASAQVWTWDTLVNDNNPTLALVRDHQHNVYSFGKGGHVLTKYSRWGSLLLQKSFPAEMKIRKIAFDNSNDLYILAGFNDTITVESQTIINNNQDDILILKYAQDGTFKWLTTIFGEGSDYAGDICFDQGGLLLVTGETSGNTNFSSVVVNKPPHRDLFIARYDTSGNYLQSFFSVFIDETNALYQSGSAAGIEIELDQNNDIVLFSSVNGKYQIDTLIIDAEAAGYVIKLDSNFHLQWAKFTGGTYAKDMDDMLINADNDIIYNINNIWHTGHDGWIRKVSENGVTLSTLIHVSGGYITGIDADGSGDLYYAAGRSEKDNNSGVPRPDFMIYSRITSSGVPVWEKIDSSYSTMRGEDITADGNEVFVSGYYSDTIHLFNDYTSGYGKFLAIIENSPLIGVAEPGPVSGFSIYPNPSTGRFTVQHGIFRGKAQLCVYDLAGNCVYSGELSGEHTVIDLSGKAKGLYFIEVSAGTEKTRGKLILD